MEAAILMIKNLHVRTKNYETRELKRLYLFSLLKRTKDGDSDLIVKYFLVLPHCRSEKHVPRSHHAWQT